MYKALLRVSISIIGLCCIFVNARAEEAEVTARDVFGRLPVTIFESTPEGLSDSEKRELLETGSTEFWEIAGEAPDFMIFVSLPFRDRAVGLRIFRNSTDGSTHAAIGTLDDPVCSLELWRLDPYGRLIPVDTPQEPEIGEFFEKKHKLPRNIHYSVLVCLGAGGLKAVPIFWNRRGMTPVKPDNEISYHWTGEEFSQKVMRRHRK